MAPWTIFLFCLVMFYVRHKKMWEGPKNGQLCGLMVEFMSDDGTTLLVIISEKISLK